MSTPTLVSTQSAAGPYPVLPVLANSLDLVWTAADVVNGNYFPAADVISLGPGRKAAGGNILLVWNTDAAPHNLTLTSQPDLAGRMGDVAAYVVGPGAISAFDFSQLAGWADSLSTVAISGDDISLKFAILRK